MINSDLILFQIFLRYISLKNHFGHCQKIKYKINENPGQKIKYKINENPCENHMFAKLQGEIK